MNRSQRTVVWICAALLAASLIYPPYQIFNRSLGYGWIFSPPSEYGIIDAGQLLVEWAGILLLSGVTFYALGGEAGARLASRWDASHRTTVLACLILRVIRGFFGLAAGVQAVSLLPVVTWAVNPSDVTGEMVAKVVIKVVVLLLSLLAFSVLRKVISRLYAWKFGVPHPAMAGRWSL